MIKLDQSEFFVNFLSWGVDGEIRSVWCEVCELSWFHQSSSSFSCVLLLLPFICLPCPQAGLPHGSKQDRHVAQFQGHIHFLQFFQLGGQRPPRVYKHILEDLYVL